jgi:peptidoglycan/LPS O-acetylase OafA/YrhL
MNDLKKKKFEIEINGLRGVAILLVIFFHYKIYPFTGGFIGVDIFFVISGYLIGKIIENKNLNFYNYKIFILNRVRRIFPGIIFLIFFSFLAFSLILSPKHLNDLSYSIISNLFLLPNLYFWSQSNYFDISSFFRPLLHTWSLGVEYHFYIFWPLIVWLISFFTKRLIIKNLIFITIILISLLILNYAISIGPVIEHKFFYGKYVSDTIFFLSPFRLFEFIFGYLISLNKIEIKKIFLNEIFFLFGIILILYASLLFDENTLFPGNNSLIPLMGVTLLIISKKSFLSSAILKNKLLNYFGTISYSLYLYHWPVLIFYKYYKFYELNLIEKYFCIFCSIIFAHFSYNYIEKFYLNKNNLVSIKKLIILPLFLLISSAFVIHLQGLDFRLSRYEKNIISNVDNKSGGVCNKFKDIIKKNDDCIFGNKEKLDLLLMGDSHGKVLFNGLKTFSAKYKKSLITYEDFCQSYPNINSDIKNCKINYTVPDTIIIGKKFYDYQYPEDQLEKVANQYVKKIIEIRENVFFKNVNKIIVIGQVPEFYSSYGDLISCYTRPAYIDKSKCDLFFNNKIYSANKNIVTNTQNQAAKKKLNNYLGLAIDRFNDAKLKIYFFDPFEYFCDSGRCIQVKDGNLIYNDSTHLSVYGSNYLIKNIEHKLLEIIQE